MLRGLSAIIIFGNMMIMCWGQAVSGPTPRFVRPLKPLLESLKRANVSGSLEFSGHCDVETPPDFPQFRAPSPNAGSVVDVAREIFAGDPTMQVTQDTDGTVRMVERGVSTGLLDVEIGHISFESNGLPLQYAAFSAGAAAAHVILQAPEVVAYMKAHQIERQLSEGAPGSNSPYPTEAPHISGSMDDLTLSQALDRVLKTFPGIWVYESCPRPNGNGQFVNFLFLDLKHPGLFEEWEHQGSASGQP
jgi:hypothetical protein